MVRDFHEKVDFFVEFHRIDSFCQMAEYSMKHDYPSQGTLDDEV